MSTTSVSVSELSGLALDYAVAVCEGYSGWDSSEDQGDGGFLRRNEEPTWAGIYTLAYSSNWSLAGPIIEREGITLGKESLFCWWAVATDWRKNAWVEFHHVGPTPLVAAMRCYVTSKLGATVDVPSELV